MGQTMGRLARFILGDYELYRIYRCDPEIIEASEFLSHRDGGYKFRTVSRSEVSSAASSLIRKRSGFGGDGAIGYAALFAGEIVCLQWYWFGARYQQRNFWPLGENEAKSIDLLTVEAHRGKGLATALKLYSAGDMKSRGFKRLYSRIWHSDQASVRVSEKAGWRYHAMVFEWDFLGRRRRLVLPEKVADWLVGKRRADK